MFSAFFDANVLVPITLADTILSLAERELFKPYWSQRVLDETKEAIMEIHPDLPESRIDYRLQHMQQAFPEACINDYENLESLITLPDPDDRHVLAAAHKAGADLLVTNNLKDFPSTELARFGLEAVNADTFLTDLLDLAEDAVRSAIRHQSADTRNPPLTLDYILNALSRSGATAFVKELGDSERNEVCRRKRSNESNPE